MAEDLIFFVPSADFSGGFMNQTKTFSILAFSMAVASISSASPNVAATGATPSASPPVLKTAGVQTEADRKAVETLKEKTALRAVTLAKSQADAKAAAEAKALAEQLQKDAAQEGSKAKKAASELAKAKASVESLKAQISKLKAAEGGKGLEAKTAELAKAEAALSAALEAQTAAEAKSASAAKAAAEAKTSSVAKSALAVKSAAEDKAALNDLHEAQRAIDKLNEAKAAAMADRVERVAFRIETAADATDKAAAKARAAAKAKAAADAALAAQAKAAAAAKAAAEAKAALHLKATEAAQATAAAKIKADAAVKVATEEAARAREKMAQAESLTMKSKQEAVGAARLIAEAFVNAARAQAAYAEAKAEAASKTAVYLQSEVTRRMAVERQAKASLKRNDNPKSAEAEMTAAIQALGDAETKTKAAKDEADRAQAKVPALAAVAAKATRDAEKVTKNNALVLGKVLADAKSTAEAKAQAEEKLKAAQKAAASAKALAEEQAKAEVRAKAAQKAADEAKAKADADAKNKARAAEKLSASEKAQAQAEAEAQKAKDELQKARGEQAAISSQIPDRDGGYQISVNSPRSNDEEMRLFYSAAIWAKIPSSNLWTDMTLAMIRANLSTLELARDKEEFCPGYHQANDHQQQVCWLRLISALVSFESGFKPGDSFIEPNGAASVGLMALSPKECRNYETIKLLKNPVLNLSCGVRTMLHLIERDRYIDGPNGQRGAAAYWSVLRTPYKVGTYRLGKQDQIASFTRKYRSY